MTLIAAFITPGDPFNMLIMMAVLFVFYEFGIVLCRIFPKPPSDIDAPDSAEMIEV
jgi:Sec-independent protein secretion pathway component TatC